MPEFVFTFGRDHIDRSGGSLGDNFVVVIAPHIRAAREAMIEARGDKWSSVYRRDEINTGRLREVPFAQVRIMGELEATVIRLLREKGAGIKDIAKSLQIGVGTVYKALKAAETAEIAA